MSDRYAERFATIFRLNVARRSRTAKGHDEGSKTSSSKKPLLLQGEALKAKVAENVEKLIARSLRGRRRFGTDFFRAQYQGDLCEDFFDIANDGLYGPNAYAEEYGKLQESACALGKLLNIQLDTNPRYRLWTPAYTTLLVPPVLLEQAMDTFYGQLEKKLTALWDGAGNADDDGEYYESADVARVLAYIDVMQDGEIHPWMDGCGRVSTAHVMWVCAAIGVDPPLFAPTKDEHYANIRDLDRHTDYYLECFERAKAEVP